MPVNQKTVKSTKENKSNEINQKMTFAQILQAKPKSGLIMMKFGLHCIGCHIAETESLEDGCKAHGLSDKDIAKMISEINAEKD